MTCSSECSPETERRSVELGGARCGHRRDEADAKVVLRGRPDGVQSKTVAATPQVRNPEVALPEGDTDRAQCPHDGTMTANP